MANKKPQSSKEKAAESQAAKLDAEVADVREGMPLHAPVEAGLAYEEREPEKVIPPKDSDGADTPSGAALREVGAPDPENAGEPSEFVKGLRYKRAKFMKRWLG